MRKPYMKKTLSEEKCWLRVAPRERIDDVRFITNHSTGKMGYAVARTAKRRGADVT